MERAEYVKPKEYFSDKYKRAEIEKTMEYNKTHILTVTKNVNENSSEFIKGEEDSRKRLWFKLYKTQFYTICPEMFVGITGITDYTIKEYQYCIRLIESAFKEGKSLKDVSSHNVDGIEQYILSLKKQGVLPYPKLKNVDNKKKYQKIKKLVDSGMLDANEVAFIFSPMQDILAYGKQPKEVEQPKVIAVEEHTRALPTQTQGYHKLVVENYKLGYEAVAKVVPNYSKNTIQTYIRQCKVLEETNGMADVHSVPLKRAWLECYKSEEPTKLEISPESVEEKIEYEVQEETAPNVDKFVSYGVYHDGAVCTVNDDMNFLKGFQEAVRFFFDDNSFIVKIEQI